MNTVVILWLQQDRNFYAQSMEKQPTVSAFMTSMYKNNWQRMQ